MNIDPAAFAIHALPDGRVLVRTRLFADGTFTASLSPPLWQDGEPADPGPMEDWPSGLYGADGKLIAEAGG